LLPGEPRYRVTLTAAEYRDKQAGGEGSRAGGIATEREDVQPHSVLVISPAQLEALVSALPDAVNWPPGSGNGRVRKWAELPSGDARRRAYDRLASSASADPNIAWIDNEHRGADPDHLRRGRQAIQPLGEGGRAGATAQRPADRRRHRTGRPGAEKVHRRV